MRIYVASSWRNLRQPSVVEALVAHGHDVYDFRDEDTGSFVFKWSDIDTDWEKWTGEFYANHLQNNPLCMRGFCADFGGMNWADCCVLVLPCGRSAHLEAGWFVGRGKKLHILLSGEDEPELMYRMAHGIWRNMEELIGGLGHGN